MKDYLIKEGQEYARPMQLMHKYNISRPTLWRLVQEMKKLPRYKGAFKRTSPRVELINIIKFDDFMDYWTNIQERA